MIKKAILLGSIFVTIILLTTVFTSVIGQQTKDTTTTFCDSPLFNIRAKNAVKEQNKDIVTPNYIGKHKEKIIFIPTLSQKSNSVRNVLSEINRMDDNTFEKLKNIVISNLNNINTGENNDQLNTNEIFQHIRNNDISFFIEENPTILNWGIGCWIQIIVFRLIEIFLDLLNIITFACNWTSGC